MQLLVGRRSHRRACQRHEPRAGKGDVVEILARGKTRIVGQFRRERGIDFVLESGESRTEVLIARGEAHGAKPGDIVNVEVLEYPSKRSHAIGRVLEYRRPQGSARHRYGGRDTRARHSERVAGGGARRGPHVVGRSAGESEGRARGLAQRAARHDRRRRRDAISTTPCFASRRATAGGCSSRSPT